MIKNILHLSFLIFAGLCLLVSCSKDPEIPLVKSPSMSASINGIVWTADIITATKKSNTSDSVTITGSLNATDDNEIYLFLPSTAPGTYYIGTSASLREADMKHQYNGISGTIVVTSLSNNYISGTFQADCQESNGFGSMISIDNGRFTAKIE